MKSMEEMMAAAQQAAETIQKQMNEMQVKLDSIEVEGQAGGGLVKVRASAKGRILGVTIDDSLMNADDKPILEDLVAAAFNDAVRKAEETSQAKMGKLTQGMPGLPGGMKFPF
jgi:DNA-binding YbaB/EbfC family protein